MSYYKVCPFCGCHLDPCEECDCEKEEAAVSAANADNGKARFGNKPHFLASNDTRDYRRIQA